MKLFKDSMFRQLLCYLIFIPFILNPVVYGLEYSNDVSDRELLMLSIMCYYNEQKEDVSKITGGKEFDMLCFNEYASPSELKDWKMIDCVITEDTNELEGLSVVTYKKGDNVVIAFRGTDSGVVYENRWYFCPFQEHPQAKYACEYFDRIFHSNLIDENSKIYLTGHSLGGYLVLNVIGRNLYKEDFNLKFAKAVTFNGLGIGYTENRDIKKRLSSLKGVQLTNYRIEWDIVSLMGEHFTDMITLEEPRFSRSSIYNFFKNAFEVHSLYHFFKYKIFGIKEAS